MRAYAVVMVTSLYHRKDGSCVLFSVRKAGQKYLSEYHVGDFFYSFAISLLACIFRSSALTESWHRPVWTGLGIGFLAPENSHSDPSSRIQEAGYRRIGSALDCRDVESRQGENIGEVARGNVSCRRAKCNRDTWRERAVVFEWLHRSSRPKQAPDNQEQKEMDASKFEAEDKYHKGVSKRTERP